MTATHLFQSTPPVKAATKRTETMCCGRKISIHAAREGGDLNGINLFRCACISIHAAREGGDDSSKCACKQRSEFQSTPPVKAATCASYGMYLLYHISIHAAREGGDSISKYSKYASNISIHAAREGGDIIIIIIIIAVRDFNPRRP